MEHLCEKGNNKPSEKAYLIDSHAHLDMRHFDKDLDTVIDSAKKAGVGKILTVALSLPGAYQTLKICRQHPHLLVAGLGIHPHDAGKISSQIIDEMTNFLTNNRTFFMAVGEIGLDYYRNLSPQKTQQEIFRQQINMAKQLNLPVIIHCRDAYPDTLAIIKEEHIEQVGGIMHCFSGDKSFAGDCLDLGLYISLAGPLTYKNAANLREIVLKIPLDRILTETDCPYLAPEPHRGQRNEPAYVLAVVNKIAEIKRLSLEETATQIMKNFNQLFGL